MENQHPTGLTTTVAAARLKQYGPNTVAQKRRLRPLVAFLGTFNSPLLWIIIAAALVSLFLGERINAAILLLMVCLSAVLDYVNTSRSEKAVAALISRVVTTATVRRDGREREVSLTDIVPGDVVKLAAGDVIPADGWLVEADDVFVNQSALTGESMPAEKRAAPPQAAGQPTAEFPSGVLMGTSVVSGYGIMVVSQTGRQTEFGRIADRLAADEPPSDFERGIRSFSLFLMRLTVVMAVIVFFINAGARHGWLDSFIFAVAIAIGLTPELLPVILTVSLSRGAVRMAKEKVIIKHLPAIQNIGGMTVLCTDKTGTLTENAVSVVKAVDGDGRDDEEVLRQAYFSSVSQTGVTNPIDQAIIKAGRWDRSSLKKIDEIPFDFERRRESIVVEESGRRRLITKGAPEAVFAICADVRRTGRDTAFDEAGRRRAERQYTAFSQDGLRVVAVASKPIGAADFPYQPDDEQAMTFVGFVALLDPAKAGVDKTLEELGRLGVATKILTGDGRLVTEKICRDIGLPIGGSLTGADLAKLTDAEWPAAVKRTTVFARIDPEQKERIITELQRAGQVVGFLGDGINDAPALKAADVGISVNNAVDVAKETADIILLEHSLEVLKDGILEGRRTFRNTLKYIMMGLSSNFGNMVSMTVASGFLPFLPMLPTQILLNNFLYDTSQLTLSTDRVDAADLTRPTSWDLRFIRRFMFVFGPISSLFDFLTFGVLLWVFRLTAGGFQTGWFIESIASQVLVIYVIRTRRLPFVRSRPSAWLAANTLLVVAVAWLFPYLPFAGVFHLRPLPGPIVLAIGGIVVVYLLIVEATKRWFFRRFALNPAA